jgi:hypothetical protein
VCSAPPRAPHPRRRRDRRTPLGPARGSQTVVVVESVSVLIAVGGSVSGRLELVSYCADKGTSGQAREEDAASVYGYTGTL